MSENVQTCRYSSRQVYNFPNMFKLVQRWLSFLKTVRICLELYKAVNGINHMTESLSSLVLFFNFNIIQDLLKFLLNFMLLHIFVVTLYAFAYFLSLAESFRGMYFWKNAKFLQCFVFVIWDSLKSRAVLFSELSLMLKQSITNQTRF